MSELIKILEKQLEIESAAAKNKLTASNLDSISKLTTAICNLKCMENESWGREIVAEAAETAISKYSNGKYDHISMPCMTRISRQKSHIKKSGIRATGTNSWNRSAA